MNQLPDRRYCQGMAQRWDTDDRGVGVGHARALLPDAKRLLEAMDHETWVAENPEFHLLSHLETACTQLPLVLLHSTTADDGEFVVDVRWTDAQRSWRAARTAAFALVGAVVESATFIRERHEDDVLIVEAATGSLAGDSEFAPPRPRARDSGARGSVLTAATPPPAPSSARESPRPGAMAR